MADLEVGELEKRKYQWKKMEEYTETAHRECVRLVDPDVPTMQDSHWFKDRNGRTLAVFISRHEHKGETVNDNIPVSCSSYPP